MKKTCDTCCRARKRGNMVYCKYLGIDISIDHTDCKHHDYGIRRETEYEIPNITTGIRPPAGLVG